MGVLKTRKNISIFCLFILTGAMGVYYYRYSTSFYEVTLDKSSGNIPIVPLDIDKTFYKVYVDTGSRFQLGLKKEIIDEINPKLEGSIVVRDILGRSYQKQTFFLPSVKLGGRKIPNIELTESTPNFVINTNFTKSTPPAERFSRYNGHIGRELLNNFNFIIDCKNKRLLFSKNDIRKKIPSGTHLIKVKFDNSKLGYILHFKTDLGTLRLGLDTGFTVSAIRSSLSNGGVEYSPNFDRNYITTKKFCLEGYDYGPKNLFLFDVSNDLKDMDGILGMDFIEDHLIYVNNQKSKIYISKSRS